MWRYHIRMMRTLPTPLTVEGNGNQSWQQTAIRLYAREMRESGPPHNVGLPHYIRRVEETFSSPLQRGYTVTFGHPYAESGPGIPPVSVLVAYKNTECIPDERAGCSRDGGPPRN